MASNPTNMDPNYFINYLTKHGITEVKRRGNEISFACPFGCDDDHRNNEEWHCGFDCEKCLWKCFKCEKHGNFITLLKHFGDYEEWDAEQKLKRKNREAGRKKLSLETEVLKAHSNTSKSDKVCGYFNGRGISNESISKFKLGYWDLDGCHGYMIPIFNRSGHIAYIKLRKTEDDAQAEKVAKAMGKDIRPLPKYRVYPNNTKLLLVGEDQLANSHSSEVLICEGELDRIKAIQEGVKMPVVSGGGAQVFKDEWIRKLSDMRDIYLCFDRDKTQVPFKRRKLRSRIWRTSIASKE